MCTKCTHCIYLLYLLTIAVALRYNRAVVADTATGFQVGGTMTKEQIELVERKRFCCKLDCLEAPVWQIWTGNTPDDFTEACQAHVGELLLKGKTNTLHPIVDEEPTEECLHEEHEGYVCNDCGEELDPGVDIDRAMDKGEER